MSKEQMVSMTKKSSDYIAAATHVLDETLEWQRAYAAEYQRRFNVPFECATHMTDQQYREHMDYLMQTHSRLNGYVSVIPEWDLTTASDLFPVEALLQAEIFRRLKQLLSDLTNFLSERHAFKDRLGVCSCSEDNCENLAFDMNFNEVSHDIDHDEMMCTSCDSTIH